MITSTISTTPNLTTVRSNPSALGAKLAQFWRWWMGELRTAMPKSLTQMMANESHAVNLAIDVEGVSRLLVNINSVTVEERIPFKTASTSGNVIQDLLRGRGSEVRLVLDQQKVLTKQLTLPLATEENLRDVIAFDMDRQTPFKASQVYFDCKVIKRDTANNVLHTKLAVITRADADADLARLREAGANVVAIGVRDDLGGAAPYFDLLPSELCGEGKLSSKQIINRVLMAIAAVLAIIAIALPLWQKREIVKALMPRMEKAKQESVITSKVMDEFTDLSERYNFVMAKKQGTQPVSDLLDELSRLLPDNTWLQIFDIRSPTNKPREVVVSGETASSSKLIEIFEHSAMLHNTNQRTGETRSQVPGMVRFQIGAEIKPRQYVESITPAVPPIVMPLTATVTTPAAAATSAAASTTAAPKAAPALASGAAPPAVNNAAATKLPAMPAGPLPATPAAKPAAIPGTASPASNTPGRSAGPMPMFAPQVIPPPVAVDKPGDKPNTGTP